MLPMMSPSLLLCFLFAQTPPVTVEYSNVGAKMEMDIVRPKNQTGPAPAVLLIHGGGFRAGKRQSYLQQANRLAERGYVAATASYRLAPRNQFPSSVEDAKAAVRFLRANAAILHDPQLEWTSIEPTSSVHGRCCDGRAMHAVAIQHDADAIRGAGLTAAKEATREDRQDDAP